MWNLAIDHSHLEQDKVIEIVNRCQPCLKYKSSIAKKIMQGQMEFWRLVYNLTDLAKGTSKSRDREPNVKATHFALDAGAQKPLTVCTLC